jgi:antitoxin VapB
MRNPPRKAGIMREAAGHFTKTQLRPIHWHSHRAAGDNTDRAAALENPAAARWYRLIAIMATGKIFRNGRSQAVRLPKEFRFKGAEVEIRRSGQKVILEPKKQRSWPRGYWTSWGKVPKDFRAPDPLPAGSARVVIDES